MRFRLDLAYKGKDYRGFQSQPHGQTLQQAIEKSLKQVLGEVVKVESCGRTDAGVHALMHVLHIDVFAERALLRILKKDFILKINAVLPDSITVTSLKKVKDSFQARKQAHQKTYAYYLFASSKKNPFIEDYATRIPKTLNLAAMEKAAKHLTGKHDFSAFCASDSTANTKTRELLEIKILKKCPAPVFKLKGEVYYCLKFTGKGFLKQMVRNLTGILVAVGQGKLTPTEAKQVLKSKDRRKAPATAAAKGLFLEKVLY
jgi:tRNA pseudouridine38-40 synthase